MNRCGRDRRFVVYTLSIDGYVFYVGKTSIRLKDKWRSHVTENTMASLLLIKFHNSGRLIPLKHQRNCTQMLNFIK